jgi:hypothetical protein
VKGAWCKEWKQGRRFIIKIEPGEKIVERLLLFAQQEKVKHAVIISAVGSVQNIHYRGIKSGAKRPITEPRMRQHQEEGPLEMLGIEGNLITDASGNIDSHMHILMSKSSGEVLGGHLYDAEVFVSCEILLTEMIVDGVERHISATAGTPTIYINEE